MRQLYLLLFFLLTTTAFADSFRGFLLTKDGYQLTGYLNILQYSPGGNIITFTNDFGDEYTIHPFLVSGFGFNYQGEPLRFVSRRHEGMWYFLQEEVRGRAVSLFRLPRGGGPWLDDRMLRVFSTPPPEYYFEYGQGKFLAVPRNGYKRNLRRFFQEASPELAAKIGSRGYRYRDMADIVVEFNARNNRKRRRL
ncbi:hypothetical protein GGR26_003500 [Lewinella marina]|uniref:Uncharacterized protein n=1 Tax=Neolewinella marina TaxID=438751 RepID=A0A2G0CCG2_9BACT|nr:hypothetical protein [Neolewinella marina]NJB87716.1 hypothetical protein [Neolewinella marina]PHK97607.1 hypothetical protein CGL56_14310 [Neolewinella marina]